MTQSTKWMALTAVAVVVALAVGWFLLVSPKRTEAAELRTQTQQQEDANVKLQSRIAQLKAQSADVPKQRARLAEIAVNLPAAPQLPTLIRQLSTAARQSGVELASLAPAVPSVLAAGPTGASAPVAGGASATSGLAMIPIVVTADGDFFEVEQFLNKIEGFKRVFLVTGLTIGPAKDAKSAGGDVQAVINGRVFMTSATVAPAVPVARPPASAPPAS